MAMTAYWAALAEDEYDLAQHWHDCELAIETDADWVMWKNWDYHRRMVRSYRIDMPLVSRIVAADLTVGSRSRSLDP